MTNNQRPLFVLRRWSFVGPEGSMHKFEKLEVWQLAIEYADLCYAIAEKLPKQEKYNLASQMRRAAVSIALNIAEGSTSQTDPEQARFLAMAIRSLIETVACQHLIHRRNYLADTTPLREAYQASEKLVAKLQTMRRKVLEGPTLQEDGPEYDVETGTPFDVTTNDQRPMTDDQRVRRSSLVVGRAEGQRSSFVVGRSSKYYVHPTAAIDEPCEIGAGTKIWHFCHVMRGARIGERCILGQNVFIANDVVIGNNVKIQNNVSVYSGVELEDDVFCGPSCVFTNVSNPRSQIVRHHLYERTLVQRGATIGANATIVCPVTIGRYAFIGAGAVVVSDVADYALMLGVPARQKGWMSRHGHRLQNPSDDGIMVCRESGWRYKEVEPGVLRCLDWPEGEALPMTNDEKGRGAGEQGGRGAREQGSRGMEGKREKRRMEMITVKAIYEQGRVEFLEPVPQIERALVAVIFLDIDPVEALVASYGSLLEGMIWGEPMDEEGARALVEVHEELLPYSLEVEETYRKLREGAEGQGAWELRSRSPERSEGTGAEERRR